MKMPDQRTTLTDLSQLKAKPSSQEVVEHHTSRFYHAPTKTNVYYRLKSSPFTSRVSLGNEKMARQRTAVQQRVKSNSPEQTSYMRMMVAQKNYSAVANDLSRSPCTCFKPS